MEVWIVLIEDRHSDVDAQPFSSEERAAAHARSVVPDDADEVVLTGGMRRNGWVLYLSYGAEGDSVRVVRRTMDEVPGAGPAPGKPTAFSHFPPDSGMDDQAAEDNGIIG